MNKKQKCTDLTSVCDIVTIFKVYDRVFWVVVFKYAIPIFQGADGVATATILRQK